jgi:hypothetical protein
VEAAAIRPAVPEDLWAIRDLLSQRDGHAWDDDSTRWFVRGLEPERCLAWIAFDRGRPVAFTNMFLRELAAPFARLAAGYWANLYIDPEYRGQLLYPRLPLTMLAEARRSKLDLVYTSVRLRDVSQANSRIGFTRVGDFVVLMKLLRPARLLGKYRAWKAVAALSAPVDGAYGALRRATRRRAPAGLVVEEVEASGAAAAALVALVAGAAQDRIAEAWTAEGIAYRYRQTREGGRYAVLLVRRGERVVAALAYRVAERGQGILAGVLMDAMSAPGEESALAAALERAERDLHGRGCEVVLFLNGLGPAVERVMRRHGYRDSPERYDLLVWPKEKLAVTPALADRENWRFAFADHDAF